MPKFRIPLPKPGVAQLVNDSNETLVNPGNTDQISNTVLKLLRTKGLATDKELTARVKALKSYNLQESLAKIVAFHHSAIRKI